MKKIAKILSLVVSIVLISVMMTACGKVDEGTVNEVASQMQEKLFNAGYSASAEYDQNAKVSIVTGRCELSFKYAGKEKVFFTDWVSGDWYDSEEDAKLGYVEAQKVQGDLILKREGSLVYMGTEGGIALFEHDVPLTIDEGKQVMQAANYTVTDVNLTTAETVARASKKYTAVLGEESIEVLKFDDLLAATDYYQKNKSKNKDKVCEKQGYLVYLGTETAVSTYKGLENLNVIVDGYKVKMETAGYNTYAYKKGMAGAIKAKKSGSSEYDLQVGWFTNEKRAKEAYDHLVILYKDSIDKGQIKVVLEGKILFVGTEQAIADFKA